VARGELVAISPGRPAVLRLPAADPSAAACALMLLQAWPSAAASDGSRDDPPSA
jgi:hypothetical protein